MMIGSLRREQVRILRVEEGKSVVEEPYQHPQGMGITGLLRSEYFGLRATIDSESRRSLDRRNYLFAKGEDRTHAENEELSRLSNQLSELGFATSDFKDPYYALFVRKMAVHTKFHKDTLTPEEQIEQEAIADQIVEEILSDEEEALEELVDAREAFERAAEKMAQQMELLSSEGQSEKTAVAGGELEEEVQDDRELS
jgi:hypothetical protein